MKITQLSNSQLNEKIKKKQELNDLLKPFETYAGKDEVVSAQIIKEQVSADTDQKKYLTSILPLNKILDGFKSGDLITMSGISGNGKTEFLISLTKDFIDKKYKVLWISYEVNPKDFMNRFGDYDPVFFMPRQNNPNNLEWTIDRIKEAKAKYGCDIVMIDHLHF